MLVCPAFPPPPVVCSTVSMSMVTGRVRAAATDLLNRLWRQRNQVWELTPHSVDDIFPLDVCVVARKGLGVRFEEPEEIPPGGYIPRAFVPVQTAGFIDRRGNRIVVAQRFPYDCRRFTGAHEIGHWILHPNFIYHRDRPLRGHERLMPKRAREESEADAFAAELLMPSKHLQRCYFERFREPMRVSALDESAVFWLSGGRPSGERPPDFASRDKRFLSMRMATCSSFGSHHFVPLAKRFGVSPTAAGIRLEELGLILN